MALDLLREGAAIDLQQTLKATTITMKYMDAISTTVRQVHVNRLTCTWSIFSLIMPLFSLYIYRNENTETLYEKNQIVIIAIMANCFGILYKGKTILIITTIAEPVIDRELAAIGKTYAEFIILDVRLTSALSRNL